MKDCFFTRISLGCFLCVLFVITGWDINNCFTKQVPAADRNILKNIAQSFQDPIEYVLGKLRDYDLVMIGERHWVREEPIFIQNLIKRCFEKNTINVVFLEFGKFEDQGKIDAFMESDKYGPKPVIDVLRNSYEFGWGYQEYFDIFKLIYDENSNRSPFERIKLVLVDTSLDSFNLERQLYESFQQSPLQEKQKWQIVSWLRESVTDRDRFMSDVIEVYRYKMNLPKGIYYAGSSHIRKDLGKKDYGRRYFSSGGILARKYPGKVCCLTFHMSPDSWRNVSDFGLFEELFKSYGKSFAVDTKNPPISQLKLKSSIVQEGVALCEAFDGYIMLNQDNDYQPCAFVPGFYDDEFAKVVWDRLRKRKILERLPPELERFKTETPTGEELMKMIRQGLH